MKATQDYIRAHNSPEVFGVLPIAEHRALRLWVRLALELAPRFGAEHDRRSSGAVSYFRVTGC